MPYFLKGNCVHKGTKEEPGEEIKCHDTHDEAVAHMRALYASENIDEDTEKLFVEVEGKMFEFVKGGRGSGWHNPPEGTHTAENAPNFAGGPGADRKYGTESDEPPDKTRRCKCPKCGAVIVLPKGKQCEDIECPSCGGSPVATEWREDKPAEGRGGRRPDPGRTKAVDEVPPGPCPACEEKEAEKASMDAPGPTMHGEGGAIGETASVMGEDGECKCPHCGKGLPCTAKACPYCKKSIDKVERGEGDKMEEEKRTMKSEGDGEHPSSHYLVVEDPEKPTTWHLRVRGTDGELDHGLMGGAWAALHGGYRGNKYAGPNKEMALAKLRKFYESEGLDTPAEKSFTIYKSDGGEWRWLSLSNWAVVDKEREVVSEGAYRDAIAYAQKSGDWGQLDLVHVDGTDVGEADMLFVLNGGSEPAKLGAGGTWYDTAKAIRAREAIQADPAHWGMSLKFRFDPAQRVHGVYTGGIQILKHSILPQQMAASYGTAIAVQGGEMSKQLDEKAAEALRQLGHSEEEIAELAEKQKALPEEENVVEKKEEPTKEPGVVHKLYESLGRLLGVEKEAAPDASPPAEARKADEVVAPAQDEVDPAEKQDGGAEAVEQAQDTGEIVKALAPIIAESIGGAVRAELEKRDKRIEELETAIKGLSESVEEKVAARLADLPPVVKVAASQVAATATQDDAVPGLRFGEKAQDNSGFAQQLLAGIKQVVEDETAKRQYHT